MCLVSSEIFTLYSVKLNPGDIFPLFLFFKKEGNFRNFDQFKTLLTAHKSQHHSVKNIYSNSSHKYLTLSQASAPCAN